MRAHLVSRNNEYLLESGGRILNKLLGIRTDEADRNLAIDGLAFTSQNFTELPSLLKNDQTDKTEEILVFSETNESRKRKAASWRCYESIFVAIV